jgi:phenylacetate-CoA ligase
MKKIYQLPKLIQYVRKHSPFYRECYAHLGPNPELRELPLLESPAFWAANQIHGNRVLTSPLNNGIVFKSGGTSGNPKFSFFTNQEWKTFGQAFGEGMTRGGLTDGERIANLFYVGDLYASFLFIMNSIEASGQQILQFPLSGASDFTHVCETLNEFEIDVWAGVPTTLMKLAEVVYQTKTHPPKKILFGGETLYPDQRQLLSELFPKTHVQSIGYASVDGGLLGYVDSSCDPQEHRVFSEYTVLELIDEDTGQAIVSTEQAGKLYLTNLTRTFMPIIRYPVGDRAEWTEPETVLFNRKFRILGRSEEGARVGPATIYYDDVAGVLAGFHEQLHSTGFQLVLRHFEQIDQLIIRVASNSPPPNLSLKIVEALHRERPLLEKLANQRKIHQLSIEFVKADELVFQIRTGKLKRIIDERVTIKVHS